ncbi:MAG: hypothetical protein CSA50_00750 [Gammaproteobacteria bacterium]|nr:MAG: hypothetical protein CSA50_00750 [Gammaproteobacteria bacterium]
MSISNAVNPLILRFQQSRSGQNDAPEAETTIVAKSPEILPNTLISVLMHDFLGRLQVILPVNCLLDVDTLNNMLDRELQAISPDDKTSIRVKNSLANTSALPSIIDIPCLVDRQVSAMDEVYVDAGDGENFVRFNKGALNVLLEYANEEQFAVPLAEISANCGESHNDANQITQAIEKFTSLRIKQRLEDTFELPPLPETAKKIIQLRADPEAGINKLTDIVETDPSLSAQVVSWASSSFYAAPGKIKSVHDAIMRVLGFDLVMNLSMGLALGKTLQQPRDNPQGLADYWQQAVWVSAANGALVNAMAIFL